MAGCSTSATSAAWRSILPSPKVSAALDAAFVMRERSRWRQILTEAGIAFEIVGDAPKVKPRRAPDFGQHSDEILREAGCDASESWRLRASKTIA